MRLRDPRVAAGRAVERDVDVLAVVARGEDRLVVPRHLAVHGLRGRPRRTMVRGPGEQDVEPVHVDRVDGPVRGNDLDDRVELPGALACAQRLRRAERGAAVPADAERDVGRRAVAAARLLDAIAGHEDVDPRGRRVGCDGRLPVVRGGRLERDLAGPARGRRIADRPFLPDGRARRDRGRERLALPRDELGLLLRLLVQLRAVLLAGVRIRVGVAGGGVFCIGIGRVPIRRLLSGRLGRCRRLADGREVRPRRRPLPGRDQAGDDRRDRKDGDDEQHGTGDRHTTGHGSGPRAGTTSGRYHSTRPPGTASTTNARAAGPGVGSGDW